MTEQRNTPLGRAFAASDKEPLLEKCPAPTGLFDILRFHGEGSGFALPGAFLVNVIKFIPEKPVLLLLFVKYPV
jgi:hypothetical protein